MTGSFLKDLMHRVGSLAATEADEPADGALLARFVRDRDEAAFAGILTRHAPLVWGVCRGLLPVDADAEDAFQATFLALVRGANSVRTAHSLAPWLHATATRVAKKARLAAARRTNRDMAAARPEANGAAVADSTWEAGFLAVHEEIARLPETLRGAFVLCVLEGDRHADAATKLGVPVGTLSARVSRARQKLMDRLTARGLAPSAAAAALALGGSAGPAAVPAVLVHATTSTLLAGATAVPASVLTLARAATEGSVMKTKLLAAGVLVAAGMTLTGGAARLGVAEAQPPASYPSGVVPLAGSQFNSMKTISSAASRPQWEYRLEPRKSESLEVFEATLRDLGREGWEFVGSQSLISDNPARKQERGTGPTLVFKRPVPAAGNTLPGPSTMNPTTAAPFGAKPADPSAILRLETDKPSEISAVISEVFNGPGKQDRRVGISVSADAKAKQVMIQCSPTDAASIIQLVAKSNLATRIDVDLAPVEPKAAQPWPSVTPFDPRYPSPETRTDPSRPLPEEPRKDRVSRSYSVPAHLTWKDAETKANDIAKATGLSIKVELSRTNEGYFHLILSGPKDDVETFLLVLPGALKKPDDITK